MNDHSKRAKREDAAIKSIQYRPDYVQPDDDDDEIQGLYEELHTNISLKPKSQTSTVFIDTETH